ncbi:hypothetical protein V2J09_004412 [Rumex salicifolius]
MSSAGLAVSRIEESVFSSRYFNSALDFHADESIMIHLSVAGSMIPMKILGSDSIRSVKLRIQTFKGFVVKNQKLVCDGRELSRSNSLIRDYGVSHGNILHLVLKLSDLQEIKVKTVCGKELTFHIEKCRNVGYVKKQIAKKGKGLLGSEDPELFCDGEPLEDEKQIVDICKSNDAVMHLLVRKSVKIRTKPVEKNFELSIDASNLNSHGVKADLGSPVPSSDFLLEALTVNKKIQLPIPILDLVSATFSGLDNGYGPVRSAEGSGGVYLMPDSTGKDFISVFKPIDEEPKAVNNPHGLPLSVDGEGLKRGTRVGEGAFREVAAYLLDHPKNGRRSVSGEEMGFSGVPPTGLVRCFHRGFNNPEGLSVKIGSLQKFMKNYGSCEDMGPGSFPVEEVHKISVLDMRLANADRHAGNILMAKEPQSGKTILIPIDQGYCLPESFEDCTFDWLYWPQARQPYAPETIEYIKSLDAEEDISLLKMYGWELPLECAHVIRISTMLLKKGVEKGLTAFAIGNIMCRETLNKESVMEEIVEEAMDSVLPGSSESTFLETVSSIMERRLKELA